MIFTQADRERAERIEKALTSLHLDVGLRSNGLTFGHGNAAVDNHQFSLHVRLNDAFIILNELGAALGRIENLLHDDVQKRLRAIADESEAKLEVFRTHADMTTSAIVVLSGRLTKLEEFLQSNLGRALEQRKSEDERVAAAALAFIKEVNEERPKRKARRKKK